MDTTALGDTTEWIQDARAALPAGAFGDYHLAYDAGDLAGYDVVVAVTGVGADPRQLAQVLGGATQVLAVVDAAPMIAVGQEAALIYVPGNHEVMGGDIANFEEA